MKSRNIWVIRTEALYRRFLLGIPLRSRLISVLINEYPKSGGTWLAHMIRDVTNANFPQNRFPNKFPCIFHGHYAKTYAKLPTIILWRDPRDIMVSWYYHSLFKNNKNNQEKVNETRAALMFKDYEDISTNLPEFIQFAFTRQRSPGFNWNQFFDAHFHSSGELVFHTSYELLRQQPEVELTKAVSFMKLIREEKEIEQVVENNTFDKLANRNTGVEDNKSFLRKGIVGDWKNVFSESASSTLNALVENRLKEYEARFLIGS